MTQISIEQAIQLAIGCQQAGRLTEAESIYRQILAAVPNHPDSLHMLGAIASQTGRGELATQLIRQAIAAAPQNAEYHYNLGFILQSQGQLDLAIDSYQQALQIKPALVEARFNLANAFKKKGLFDQAIHSYRQALAIKPDHARALNNLGNALKDSNRADEAITCYTQALLFKPDYPEGHLNLANTLRDAGRLNESIATYHRALDLKSDYPEALLNLGIALWKDGALTEAIAAYRQAIALAPEYAEAHYSLGIALKDNNEPQQTIASYQRALQIKPGYSEARNNLAGMLWENGQLDDAISAYRQTIESDRTFVSAHDNLLYALNFHPASTPQSILEETRRWRHQHADPLAHFIQPHSNNRDPSRRLRVAYVSPDFRRHPVGRSLLPVLLNHDADQFEIVCYSSTLKPDSLTGQFQSRAALWRDVQSLSDAQLASQIRQDQIDILIDLSLHMAGSRLLVFARKPAPIQITWLGYPGTTGLQTIDYRLSDPHMDPPNQNDPFYTESTIRLPHTFQIYAPLDDDLPISLPPVNTAGHITLGCLNNYAKINEPLIQTWANILAQSKDARLILKTSTPVATRRAIDLFAHHGISPDRLKIAADFPTHQAYMQQYHQIDLALDPFPYNGHTTSMDALWMGVPVLSRHGTTAVSRAGLSQSTNLGLPSLAVESEAQYIRAAVELIQDAKQLAKLRHSLRDRMRASALMDAPAFTRELEDALRMIWRTWCAE